jgi:hypothetical protein
MLIKRLTEEATATAEVEESENSLEDLLIAYEKITREISSILSVTSNESKDSKKKVSESLFTLTEDLRTVLVEISKRAPIPKGRREPTEGEIFMTHLEEALTSEFHFKDVDVSDNTVKIKDEVGTFTLSVK